MQFRFGIMLMCFLICQSCYHNQDHDDRLFPSDYLYLQRSYPYDSLDIKAYQHAVQWSNQLKNSTQKSIGSWESLGPINFDGRVTDIELHPSDDNVLFVGTASGGIFRSNNGGANWVPIFDNAQSLSIGDLAVSRTNPNIIYAGTGESNAGGGSIAYDGTGVYKSENGGQSWIQAGLSNAGSIGKIVIDPTDDNTLFVAAMGALFKNDDNGGIYKSRDGGNNWERTLFLSDSTGAIDLAIHPTDGNIIYAAMWERIRRPYNRQYGGETSGIYYSADGGESWEELTNGLPTHPSNMGRIGLAISPSDPQILYAYYAKTNGNLEGIFKTEDGGISWERMSVDGIQNVSFMWWFGKIYVHPDNPDKVYVTALNMYASEDGAQSWRQIFNDAHVDHHAFAFLQSEAGTFINGNDGGVYKNSQSGNGSSEYLNGLNNFQFYTCTLDPSNSQVCYGGAQDNGIFRMNDRSGVGEKLFGGDGFRILVDPTNPEQIYYEAQNGAIFASSDGGETNYFAAAFIEGQFNWNTPLAMDPINPSIIYTGTQNLFRSEDKGRTWNRISDPLVRGDNPSGSIPFGTLTYIEVSSNDRNVIYIGCDDGSLWISRDFGDTYSSISSGLPERWITSIEADPWKDSGVFVTLSGFRFGESNAQIFYSSDWGQNWESIGQNFPDVPVNDLIADDKIKDQLYVACDIGVFTSTDFGESWQILASQLPNVPMLDLDMHREDRWLVAASFGRGIYGTELPSISQNSNSVIIDLVVYPNPSQGKIFVKTESNIEKVEIYDYYGLHFSLQMSGNQIILDNLPSGSYILIFYTNHGRVVRKLNNY